MKSARVLIGRKDDRCSLIVKSVEGVKEFDHRGSFGRQELNVFNDQTAGAAEPGRNPLRVPERIDSRNPLVNASALI